VLGSAWVFSLRAVTVALALAMLCLALLTVTAIAADPTPAASGALIDPLDPRAGAGVNRVGAPLVALFAVVGIGMATALLTAIYVRFTRARSR
jgi:hypothetical protein